MLGFFQTSKTSYIPTLLVGNGQENANHCVVSAFQFRVLEEAWDIPAFMKSYTDWYKDSCLPTMQIRSNDDNMERTEGNSHVIAVTIYLVSLDKHNSPSFIPSEISGESPGAS